MKILIVLLALMVPIMLVAQDSMPAPQDQPQGQPEKPKEEAKPTETEKPKADAFAWVEGAVKRLAERGGLSEDQLKAIVEKVKGKLQEIAKIRESGLTELKELLGEETFKKIERDLGRIVREEGNRNGGAQGGALGGSNIFDQMKKDLGLSEEQLKQLQPLSEEYGTKLRKIMEDARGQGRDGMRAVGEKMREATDEFVKQAKEHLNDDQDGKLDEMVKKMRDRMGGGRQRGGGNRNGGGEKQAEPKKEGEAPPEKKD